MDSLSSEQQICGGTKIIFVVRKTGALGIAQTGLAAGRQAGWLEVNSLATYRIASIFTAFNEGYPKVIYQSLKLC